MAASGGMGNGVAEPPIAMTVTQNANQISIAMKYEAEGAPRNGRPTSAVFTLDGKMNQVPDPEDARPAYNYKRIATWDGARLVLRTIHGLNNVREVWVLEGNVLKLQRAAQTPGCGRFGRRAISFTTRDLRIGRSHFRVLASRFGFRSAST
jgi:hypothetical protein